jgi:hypothetical protein
MNSRNRAPGRCRPLAPVGVIEVPRVQLKLGLFRTKEKTDLFADGDDKIPKAKQRQKFHPGRVGPRPVVN